MTIQSAIVAGQTFLLHPYRAAYWEEADTLLIADLHLGKARHFRREGIPVPSAVGNENWDKLIALLLEFEPGRVLLLGDLFHSVYNSAWEEFGELLEQFAHIRFELVLGNHDILDAHHYERVGLHIYPDTLLESPFLFTHEPLEEIPEGVYNICGHLHPGVKLYGGGGSLRLPCFHFGEQQGIFPAFGAFTGLAIMRARRTDAIYVVTDEAVIAAS